MLPAEEKIERCRKCRLPARLRDVHLLGLAKRDGRELVKAHIIRELGKDTLEAIGGESRGLMQWIAGILRYEGWEKEAQRKGGLPHERSL